ncbi:MAG: hypothetical protein PHV74_11430 [Dehalococcoidia bacterium]|nr:hypothetical protein [Dehalococcoidia bacterium]
MKPDPVEYEITDHAVFEIQRRGIPLDMVRAIVHKPEQRLMVREGREVFQSRVQMSGKRYLIRVFVDTDRAPAEVVTVYRTSKIDKYWR